MPSRKIILREEPAPYQQQPRHPLHGGMKPVLHTNLGALFDQDCKNIFASIKDGCLDAIFADPPFNLGKDYGPGPFKDTWHREAYLNWSFSWIDEGIRTLKPGGSLFIYILPFWGYHFASFLDRRGMTFRHWIALSMKGTFPRGKKLYPAHYALLYFSKGEPSVVNKVRLPVPACRHCGGDIKDYGGHRKYLNPLGLNLTDFWDDTSPARHKKFKARKHINELKPMIPQRCFEIATNAGDLVFDPFGGGGSSYVAAQDLGRYWIGTEINTSSAIKARLKETFPLACNSIFPRKIVEAMK